MHVFCLCNLPIGLQGPFPGLCLCPRKLRFPTAGAGLDRRSVGNSRLVLTPDDYLGAVIAAVFIVLMLIGEAALFGYAVKTMPDFPSQADVQVP